MKSLRDSLLCLLLASMAVFAVVDTAAAQEAEPAVGDAKNAMPGLNRVGIAAEGSRGLHLAGSAGYGYTESVLGSGDTHNRIFGTLAASLRPVRWLSIALQFDGRYDKHAKVPGGGSDDGFVGDPRLLVRYSRDVGKSLHLGLQGGVWVPGDRPPSVIFKAASFDLEALASYTIPVANGGVTLASRAGFRFDQSAKSVDNADSLSRADRMALGVSDYNAALLGVGAVWQSGRVEVLGEWSWDLLVGSNAPAAMKSPMRASAGVRWAATSDRALRLQLILEAGLSSRPVIDVGQPLIPVEPRFSAMASVLYRLPFLEPAASRNTSDDDETNRNPNGTDGTSATKGSLRGRVVADDGSAIGGATVHIGPEDGGIDITTGPDGRFEATDLETGELSLSASADKYEPASRTVTVVPGKAVDVELVLKIVVPKGQLRGVVRSFTGKSVEASVRVEPIGQEASVDADGAFQLDVPPGDYEVVIIARGYVEQRRKVRVEENGVTVLNVDLRRGK